MPSTQNPNATAQQPRATAQPLRLILDGEDLAERTDRVRSLLRQNLPLGVKQAIGEQLRLRKESVTRQLDTQRTERLSEDVAILGQLWLEQVEGMEDVAREVRELRYAGLATITLQLPAGCDTWTVTFNRKTGEVKP